MPFDRNLPLQRAHAASGVLSSRFRLSLLAGAAAMLALGLQTGPAAAQPAAEAWIGTWAAPAQPVWGADFPVPWNLPRNLWNQTVRQIAHVSMGGKQVRVVLTNAFGISPLVIGAAHVALAGPGASIAAGSDRVLTFSGAASVAIPPGAPMISDPVDLDVPPLGNVAVSLFLPGVTPLATAHWEGVQTAYISGPGNHVGDAEITPQGGTMKARVFLSGIMVDAPPDAQAVVTFGNSITDGANSTPDADHRWPDVLAARLQKAGDAHVAVLNEGISGERVLRSRMGLNALANFGPDVLAWSRVKTVVLMMGINDIGWPGSGLAPHEPGPAADDVIEGYKQIILRAHLHGLRIIGATLTPFENAFKGTPFEGFYTAEKEAKREAINQFIRGGAFDGVFDFDATVRDPEHPTQIQARFNSGDQLHPNDAGYTAMANSIDLGMLTRPNP